MTEYRLNKRENQIQSILANLNGIYKKRLKNSLKTRFLGGLNVNISKSGCLEAVRAIIKKFKGN